MTETVGAAVAADSAAEARCRGLSVEFWAEWAVTIEVHRAVGEAAVLPAAEIGAVSAAAAISAAAARAEIGNFHLSFIIQQRLINDR